MQNIDLFNMNNNRVISHNGNFDHIVKQCLKKHHFISSANLYTL